MMKKILICIIILFSISCSNNDIQNNQTELEGVWLLQNITNGAKLTFESKNFTIQSGSVTITGTFELSNSQINGKVVTRNGTSSNLLQPNTFTGNFEISNDRVTFSNFSGNWRAPFSSWYSRK
ncbi:MULTISPECIES: hypothetical protein [unclassified Polaribacter]|uniref:hypothetical protein n=1 Tax=unclassified Polaribacter TaxID=196858 RepID=UPI0011BE0CC9|nr:MULTISPECIES: hypothetical protein [unclassified Polaribacter]TXD48161.1 hypothetical protein ES043_17945 [Polaribacter sp. IC063]TXD55643.1 hypothetical protein ES044_17875 [Polaribacter sp. IC066]